MSPGARNCRIHSHPNLSHHVSSRTNKSHPWQPRLSHHASSHSEISHPLRAKSQPLRVQPPWASSPPATLNILRPSQLSLSHRAYSHSKMSKFQHLQHFNIFYKIHVDFNISAFQHFNILCRKLFDFNISAFQHFNISACSIFPTFPTCQHVQHSNSSYKIQFGFNISTCQR